MHSSLTLSLPCRSNADVPRLYPLRPRTLCVPYWLTSCLASCAQKPAPYPYSQVQQEIYLAVPWLYLLHARTHFLTFRSIQPKSSCSQLVPLSTQRTQYKFLLTVNKQAFLCVSIIGGKTPQKRSNQWIEYVQDHFAASQRPTTFTV